MTLLRSGSRTRGKSPGHSGLGGAEPNEVGQVGSLGLGHVKSSAKVVPERDAQLGAGQQQAEESIAAVTAVVRACAAGDLAPDHLRAQVALGTIGVQGQLWPL